MFSLEGKKALVTGASGGIGEAIVQALHGQGATVGLSGTRVEKLEHLTQKLGTRVFVFPCRLDDAQALESLIPTAEEAMGRVDILVNNAGVTKDQLSLLMKQEDWDTVLKVNLSASFKLSQMALKGMMKNRWGRIINITSVVGVTGNAGQANYAASKAGLIGLSKSLALEVAKRGITINCVAPGFIESPMTDHLNEKVQEKILSSIPMGRMGTAQEIAHAVTFLASPEAQYITGQTLHVNGGMVMP